MLRILNVGAALGAMLVLVSGGACGADSPQGGAKGGVAKAIAAMRKVDVASLSEDEQEARTKEIDQAWKTLIAAGPAGADALKAELKALDAAKEKDDFFRLGAAVLLWEIGKLDEARAIADLWTGDVALDTNYPYVFFAAFEAARTQDERALPMLTACLRDKKGTVFVAQHSMDVAWPRTHEFLWGAFGPKGMPALARVLDESKDETALASAALLLARAQYLPALEKVRKLAHDGKGEARRMAVRSLGIYGHPDDFDFLVAGLKAPDPNEAMDFAYALYEFEDLRAAPALVPLVASDDVALRREAIGGLCYLVTPEGIEALHKYAAAPKDEEEGRRAETWLARSLEAEGLTWETFAAKSPDERKATIAAIRARGEQHYVLKPDDRKLDHDELLKAAAQWKENLRITGGDYKWVEDRHALAASTPADIDLWLDVKAKVCCRLSDECLSEVRTIDNLVARLGRSRYRKAVGITEKAEPKK